MSEAKFVAMFPRQGDNPDAPAYLRVTYNDVAVLLKWPFTDDATTDLFRVLDNLTRLTKRALGERIVVVETGDLDGELEELLKREQSDEGDTDEPA